MMMTPSTTAMMMMSTTMYILLQPIIYTILAILFWLPGLYFFVSSPVVKLLSQTPLLSILQKLVSH